jgi:large subunit ribosomal protein L47
MFMSRILRRTLFSAAKSEASAAAAATSAPVRTARNPLEEFFEVERSTEEEKPISYGILSDLLFV